MKHEISTRGRWFTLLFAAATGPLGCLISSYLAARVFVGMNNGFGAVDIPPFIYYTIPFCVGLFVLSLGSLVLTKLRPPLRLIVAPLVGAAAGFLYTVFNRWMLGMWFGAWSFPVLYCWIVGGAVGMLSAIMVQLLLPRTHQMEEAAKAEL